MKKRIILAIMGLLVIVGILAATKTLQIKSMIDNGKAFAPPPDTVTTTTTKGETWEMSLGAVGSLTAVQGVTVATEISGKVVKIAFEPGMAVKKGDLLLQQDTSTEEAQLPGAQAQAETLKATIAKKTVRALFSGRLGIRQVNLGQILREGKAIVTLQALDPILVDFTLHQQQLAQVKLGLNVRLTGDALGKETLTGRITAINPLVAKGHGRDPDQATTAEQATTGA